ncbi:MAG: hypothetical protein K2Y05_05265 [Hyphomicrobiaceae bacterium]|nr:hypothetical protein [Hyphomicrobiaceae bacterium]
MIYVKIVLELIATAAASLQMRLAALVPHRPAAQPAPTVGRKGISRDIAAVLAGALLIFATVVGTRHWLAEPPDDTGRMPGPVPVAAETKPAFAPLSTVASTGPRQLPAGADAGTGGPSRATLIRAIQTGLQTAGCYDGAVNGYWSPKTREGMRRLLDSLDARLPIDQPDAALRAILEANPNARCGGPSTAKATPKGTENGGTENKRAANTAAKSPAASEQQPTPAPIETKTATSRADEANAGSADAAPTDAAAATAAGAAAAATAATLTSANDSTRGRRRTATADPSDDQPKPARRTRRKQANAFDNVSRNMTRNFRSVQRSLSALFR